MWQLHTLQCYNACLYWSVLMHEILWNDYHLTSLSCVYSCMYMFLFVCKGQKPTLGVLFFGNCLSFLETWSLTGFDRWPVNPRGLSIFTSPALGLQTSIMPGWFALGCKDQTQVLEISWNAYHQLSHLSSLTISNAILLILISCCALDLKNLSSNCGPLTYISIFLPFQFLVSNPLISISMGGQAVIVISCLSYFM